MENKILVETSARHVHLTTEAVEALFGKGYKLTVKKPLSQPGQYACEERVTVVGPKKEIANVIILGPERKACQVEVSLTDARTLGVCAPVRESGDVAGSAGSKGHTGLGVSPYCKGFAEQFSRFHVCHESLFAPDILLDHVDRSAEDDANIMNAFIVKDNHFPLVERALVAP